MATVSPRRLQAALTCALALELLAGAAAAGAGAPTTGSIEGTVLDQDTGNPIPYVGVVIAGTSIGTMTRAKGEFRIASLQPGMYSLRASIVGHEPRTLVNVGVDAGRTTSVRFALKRNFGKTVPAIIVRRDPLAVDVHSSQQTHSGTGESVIKLPLETVSEAVATQPGIVMQQGEFHIQGGYAHQTAIQIDGVAVTDPLGGSALELGKLSLADYTAITGGLDAEYGNATSVINYMTRAGGKRLEGNLRYTTDDYGRADKTFTNYDQLSMGLGGPTPFQSLSYYVSGELTFMDGEAVSGKSRPETRYLNGLVQTRERAVARARGQGRLDWKLGSGIHMTGEITIDRGREDPYVHNWNAAGWVARVVAYPALRPDNFHPGYYTVSNEKITLMDGPWRHAAATASYTDLRDDPECIYCLVPVSEARTVRGVRTVSGAPGTLGPVRFALVDWPLFEGWQRPTSSWVPDLEGAPGDTSRQYFNAADHVPRSETLSRQMKWSLTHTLSPKSFYEVRVSRFSSDATTTVNGKTPAEFATAGKLLWIPGHGPQQVGTVAFYTDPSVPFLATAYDYPFYSRRETETYLLRADMTTNRWANHRAKSGVLVQYSDLDQAEMAFPGQQTSFRGPWGINRNTFHAFSPEGAIYVQDRWEHEGMVVNAGLRFDFFSPGSGASINIYNDQIPRDVQRWQKQWSPRLGLAFPITERDVFHFHYGRYVQFPEKLRVFSSQDPNSNGIIGNPNLSPETSIAFQAGVKHQWTSGVSTQVALFNRDLYGLVTSREVTDDSTGLQLVRYVNKTYASSRGVELSLAKAMSRGFGLEVAYTWSFADGVSSDADFGRAAQGLTHLPTGELPLNWDQRHTLNVTLTLARPGEWSATTLYQYGSGLPWTPRYRYEKKQDPMLENSRRLPATHSLGIVGQKSFQTHGRQLNLFFEGRNLLDEKQVYDIDPSVVPAPPDAQPAYTEYATETGHFGGAYLHDSDGDGRDEFYPVQDPRVYGPRRLFRVGLGVEF